MLNEDVTIIIIEDELAHAEAIKRSLSRHHCNILVCFSLDEYRTIIETVNPDIVFTDMNLPDGNAFEILESDSEMQRFPIVVMSAFGDESTLQYGFKL